jgi:hypothetical protein
MALLSKFQDNEAVVLQGSRWSSPNSQARRSELPRGHGRARSRRLFVSAEHSWC